MYQTRSFSEGIEKGYTAFYFENSKREQNKTYMEYAIQIAKLSSSEDKKGKFRGVSIPQPKIGAILVTNDYIYCAARSGVKHGDHAEFTILETFLGDHVIEENDILYTTLEPCTPESRSSWTESCSSLIINKKLKNVCVGTLDANPLVFGVGLNMLIEKGINVSFFEKQYVDELNEINKDFFEFCKKYPDIKILKRVDQFLKDKIDEEALKVYYDIEEINDEVYIKFYRERIDSEGNINGNLRITKEMALAFAKKPSYFIPGYNTGIIDKIGNSMTEKHYINKRELIDKSLLTLCSINCKNNIFELIAKKISSETEFSKDTLKKIFSKNLINIVDLKEYIVNAFVHNNYSENLGVTIEIITNKNINIINMLSNEIQFAERDAIQLSFNQATLFSIPTNPVLMQFFVDSKLAENTGLGINENPNVKFIINKQIDRYILVTEIKK